MNDILKEWDAEISNIQAQDIGFPLYGPVRLDSSILRRFRILIAVVKKQHETIEFLSGKRQGDGILRVPTEFIDKALMETENMLHE